MKIDRTAYNDSILEVADKFDGDNEIEVDILNPEGDRSIWLTKKEVKRLVSHLINVL